MERDGLVTRHRDEDDGRLQRIRLTGRARRLRKMAVAEAAAVNGLAFAGMSAAERRQLLTLVARMIAALNRPRG